MHIEEEQTYASRTLLQDARQVLNPKTSEPWYLPHRLVQRLPRPNENKKNSGLYGDEK